MSNKVTRLIKRFLQNHKLNREKFVKNKQIYKDYLNKNRKININNIINRNMSTYHSSYRRYDTEQEEGEIDYFT